MGKIGSRKCLVTGATGVIGVPLVRELLGRGDRVRILTRSGDAADLFGGSVEVIRGDVRDAAVVDSISNDIDWVFHLAAKLHVNDPRPEALDEYRLVNVTGTENLIKAAAGNGVRKFVFFSTINVYGPGAPGKVFDETSEPNPQGIYAVSKLEAERIVLAARSKDGGGPFGIVLRSAAVYGSRMKGNYVRLVEAIRRGRFFLIGSGDNRRTLVHQSDAAHAAVLAAEQALGGSVYNVTDGSIHKLSEIVEAIGKAVGKGGPRIRIPVAPVRIGIAAAEGLTKAIGLNSPVSRGLLEKFLEDIAVDGGKIGREIGFSPRYDPLAGWKEAAGP